MNYSEKEFDADYEKICDFENLYKAHKKTRLGKRQVTECIDFEMNLGEQLASLSKILKIIRTGCSPITVLWFMIPKID